MPLDYSNAAVPVREDLVEAHHAVLGHLTRAGTWWDGAERSAIAESARQAIDCALCKDRKAALSPYSVDGVHDDDSGHGPVVVDVVHRVVTDPGRLARRWYDDAVATDALDPGCFVEAIAVATFITALDVFARAVGTEPVSLPAPSDGEPTRRTPTGLETDGAWVPRLLPGSDDWNRLYPDRAHVAEVERAWSLVPAEVEMLGNFARPHYMAFENVTRHRHVEPNRAIDRMQMEFVASRVSAYNDCFY